MGTLADLNRTFGAESLGDADLARKLGPLLEHLQRNFTAIRDAFVNGITLTDNIDCEVVSAKFSHGVGQNIRLKRMKQATAAVVLSADGSVPWGAPALVNVGPQQVRLTIWFNDTTAASKTVNLLLLNAGTGLITQPTFNAPLAIATPADGTYNVKFTGGVPSYIVGSGGTGASFWDLAQKPTTPDSRDEEFEAGAFPGNWTVFSTTADAVNGIDPYASFAGTSFRYDWNSKRPSWMLIQPVNGGSDAGFTLPVTINTNDFVYMRVRNDGQYNTSATGYTALEIDSASGADPRAGIQLSSANGNNLTYYWVNAAHAFSSTAVLTTRLLGGIGGSSVIEYIGIHKIGKVAHFWVAGPNGHWIYVASQTPDAASWPAAAVRLRFTSSIGAGSAGNQIGGVDFVRFKNTATDLP